MKIVAITTLSFSIWTVFSFLIIDHLINGLYFIAIILYFWTALAVYLLCPVYLVLGLIPSTRRSIDGWIVLLNLLAAGACFWFGENSKAIEAIMSV